VLVLETKKPQIICIAKKQSGCWTLDAICYLLSRPAEVRESICGEGKEETLENRERRSGYVLKEAASV
jgi:hypothetical protein